VARLGVRLRVGCNCFIMAVRFVSGFWFLVTGFWFALRAFEQFRVSGFALRAFEACLPPGRSFWFQVCATRVSGFQGFRVSVFQKFKVQSSKASHSRFKVLSCSCVFVQS
jgi:hypothetical protein